MMLKDPMAYVPDSMKNAVTFLQQKWGEISAAAKAMISVRTYAMTSHISLSS